MPDSPRGPLRIFGPLRRAVVQVRTAPYRMGAWWTTRREPRAVQVLPSRSTRPIVQLAPRTVVQVQQDQTAAAQPGYQAPKPNQVQDQVQDRQSTWSTLLDRVKTGIELAPLVVPLAAAGYYQSDMAHHVFHWDYPWAIAFPVSFEGGTAWAARNYEKRLLAQNSLIMARLGLLGIPAASSLLLFWHAKTSGAPWQAAAAIAGLTLIGLWVWLQRAGQRSQAKRQALGLVDERMVRFAVARWIMCPVETARATRFAVRYGITSPREALDHYRLWRYGPDHGPELDQGEDRDRSEPVLTVQSTRTTTETTATRTTTVQTSITPAVAAMVDQLDQTYPDQIPSRRIVMDHMEWTSAGRTSEAIKELKRRRSA